MNDARHQSYMCFAIQVSGIILRPFYGRVRSPRPYIVSIFLDFHQMFTIYAQRNRIEFAPIKKFLPLTSFPLK